MNAAGTRPDHSAAHESTKVSLPQLRVSLDELIARTRLSDVVAALGGPEVKRGRCAAWYRGGDNPTSLSIDDPRRWWRDFKTGEYGGILDLIQIVVGCSRSEAAEWLAGYHGTSLARQSPQQTREWRRRHEQAEQAANELTAWREKTSRALLDERNRLFNSEGVCSAAARVFLAQDDPSGEELWDGIWAGVLDGQRADELQRELERLEFASPAQLAVLRGATQSVDA